MQVTYDANSDIGYTWKHAYVAAKYGFPNTLSTWFKKMRINQGGIQISNIQLVGSEAFTVS